MDSRKKPLIAAVLAVTVLASGAASSLAAGPAKPELSLTLDVRKEAIVRDAEGNAKTEWREAKDVFPGDVLKYTITYRNAGSAEARDGSVVDPVPKDTCYVPGSAEGKDTAIAFSIDGKRFLEPRMLKYRERRADGTEAERTAPPEMYTHIRWKLLKAVPPGGAGSVSFKARVK